MGDTPYDQRHCFVDPDSEGMASCFLCGLEHDDPAADSPCPKRLRRGTRVRVTCTHCERFGHEGVVTEHGAMVSVTFARAKAADGCRELGCHIYHNVNELEVLHDQPPQHA